VPAYFGNGAEPVQLGVDASNNLWLASYTSNRLYKLTTASRTLTDVTSGTTVSLNGAFSATVDGNGGVWVSNRGSNDISYFENSGTAVTQTVNYQNGSGLLSTPLNAAVDGSATSGSPITPVTASRSWSARRARWSRPAPQRRAGVCWGKSRSDREIKEG
jgi:hypothetical protein